MQSVVEGTRVFRRLGVLRWVAFLLVGGLLAVLLFGKSGLPILLSESVICAVLTLAAVNEKYIVTEDSIAHINWLGIRKEEIPWKDVGALRYRYSYRGSRCYRLQGPYSHINVDTDIDHWQDLQRFITDHLPAEAHVQLTKRY